MGEEALHALGHAYLGVVVEVAFGGGDVEPVVFGELGGDEAGHGGLAFEAEEFPEDFHEGTDFVGFGVADVSLDFGYVVVFEELVDPVPEVYGLVVGDEVGFAAGVVLGVVEGDLGEEVGVDDVVDVGEVDAVLAVADDAELAGAGSLEDAGDEVGVVVAPDEVGAQGDGFEVAGGEAVGGEDGFFGDDFGGGIGAGDVGAVGEGFVGAGDVLVVEDDGGGGGVDEFFDGEVSAAVDDGLGAFDVGFLVVWVGAPDADFCGDVVDGVLVLAGGADGGGVGEVGVGDLDAEGFDVGAGASADAGDLAALGEQAFGEGEADEAADSGDEDAAWW